MKGKVLLVDDDNSVRTVLTEVLGEEFQVSEAENGAAQGEGQDMSCARLPGACAG